jgi:hypothetical protein
MKKKIKKAWIKALESREVNGKPVVQTEGTLRRIGKTTTEDGRRATQLCCLGVLCEIAVAEGVIPKPEKTHGDFVYDAGATAELPDSVREWAGLDHNDPEVKIEGLFGNVTLAGLNDNHEYTFADIAKVIKEQL